MANIFYQFVLLEAVMPINCVQLKYMCVYIYIYTYVYIFIFLLSKKHPLPTVVCLNIWGECSVTCCCCCSGLYGFCSVLFLCGKLIFKKNKKQQKITTTTVYILKNHCFLYYWDPKSRLSKAGVGFKLLLWCGLRVCSVST